MKYATAISLGFSLLLTACATAPLITDEVGFPLAVPADRAFDAALAAGTDLGFVPLKGPPPDKVKGSVWFQVGGSASTEAMKRVVLASAMFTHEFILQVYLRKEGNAATGVDLKANRTGVGEFTPEQGKRLQEIFAAYREALQARLKGTPP